MYQFKSQRDQQQSTTVHLTKGGSLVTVKAGRVQPAHLHNNQSSLQLEFSIHENHEHSSTWSALEHWLQAQFNDIVAGEYLPISALKTHIFILSADQDIESCIFNSVWVAFLLHGIPMKLSVFHYQWTDKEAKGKVVLDLHQPERILTGEYDALPPPAAGTACQEYKRELLGFLQRQWGGL